MLFRSGAGGDPSSAGAVVGAVPWEGRTEEEEEETEEVRCYSQSSGTLTEEGEVPAAQERGRKWSHWARERRRAEAGEGRKLAEEEVAEKIWGEVEEEGGRPAVAVAAAASREVAGQLGGRQVRWAGRATEMASSAEDAAEQWSKTLRATRNQPR